MDKDFNVDQLRDILEDLYGEVLSLLEECPGVYYASVRQDEADTFPHEYYIVYKAADAISSKAKAYGQPVDGYPDLLVYPMDKPDGGYKIVEYELCRYKLLHGESVAISDSLYELAVHSAEYHPDYFGAYPAPMLTPHGYMVRYHTLENGIHLLETDQGMELVAFCFPLWNVLSTFAQKAGEHTAYDIRHGVDETKGYLFFPKSKSCIAFFELWAEHPSWANSPIYNFPAIMNAIWEHFPDYATVYNLAEQKGLNSISGTLLEIVDEIDLSVRPEKMITLDPEIGTEFINTDYWTEQETIEKYLSCLRGENLYKEIAQNGQASFIAERVQALTDNEIYCLLLFSIESDLNLEHDAVAYEVVDRCLKVQMERHPLKIDTEAAYKRFRRLLEDEFGCTPE